MLTKMSETKKSVTRGVVYVPLRFTLKKGILKNDLAKFHFLRNFEGIWVNTFWVTAKKSTKTLTLTGLLQKTLLKT